MTTKEQLLQSINETEQQLNKLKQELESHNPPTIQEASAGDVLEDGSILLKKENGLTLLISPKSTEVYHMKWTKEFPEVYSKLSEQGFIPSQWFIPTIEQLHLAYRVIPNEFGYHYYWSSNESGELGAYSLSVSDQGGASQCQNYRRTPSAVRAVRCISY
jgi:hypothetical protein